MIVIYVFYGLVLLLLIAWIVKSVIDLNKSDSNAFVQMYLTQEEMENRPVIEQVKEEEKVEVVNDGYFLYDIIPLHGDLQLHAQKLCREHHVAFSFFIAMLESESSFSKEIGINYTAQGDGGNSVGYMQINKPNWDRYGLNAFVPEDNIEIGIRMMSEYIEKYQEFDMVVMCYKAGEGKALELREQGIRLSACDSVAENAIWWEMQMEESRGE